MSLRVPLLALAVIAAPAAAQEASRPGTPTVEQYLCTFAGKCDGAQGPLATRDAPETRGFRLARPSAEQPAAASSAPRTTKASAAVRERPAPRASAGTRAAMASERAAPRYAATAPAALPAAGARPRADLLIGFELNSARLTARGREAAQVFARSMQMPELRGMRFRIEGHTDLRGGAAINDPLSRQRAQAVANYLAAQGVDRSRLETRGFGASRPLEGHGAADPVNRRVEAELIS